MSEWETSGAACLMTTLPTYDEARTAVESKKYTYVDWFVLHQMPRVSDPTVVGAWCGQLADALEEARGSGAADRQTVCASAWEPTLGDLKIAADAHWNASNGSADIHPMRAALIAGAGPAIAAKDREIERLREALSGLLEHFLTHTQWADCGYWDSDDNVVRRANAALASVQEQPK